MRNKLNLFLIIATLLFISACGEEPANNEKEEDNELVAEESNEDEEQKNDSTEDENSNEDSQVETDKNETSEESDEKSKIASEIAEKINSIDFESPNNVNSDLAKFHTQTPEGIMVYEAHNILREEKLELYGIEGIVIERDVKHATNASSVSVETSDLITSEEEIKEIFGLIEDNTWDDLRHFSSEDLENVYTIFIQSEEFTTKNPNAPDRGDYDFLENLTVRVSYSNDIEEGAFIGGGIISRALPRDLRVINHKELKETLESYFEQ